MIWLSWTTNNYLSADLKFEKNQKKKAAATEGESAMPAKSDNSTALLKVEDVALADGAASMLMGAWGL